MSFDPEVTRIIPVEERLGSNVTSRIARDQIEDVRDQIEYVRDQIE